MKGKREKSGQFVIIAVLLASIMIISIGAMMHSAVTYYKHEPWEEYSALIGDIELNCRRLLELSLANYAYSFDTNILRTNLELWQENIADIYFGDGISLGFSLAQGAINVNGLNLVFSQGLTINGWNTTTATSAARADFTLNISSIGMEGYRFASTAFLNLKIIDISTVGKITVAVQGENNLAVAHLGKANFKINNDPDAIISVSARTDPYYVLIYDITYEGASPPFVQVWDERGISAVARPY